MREQTGFRTSSWSSIIKIPCLIELNNLIKNVKIVLLKKVKSIVRIPTKKCNSFNFALLQWLLLPIDFYFGHCTGRWARHIVFAFRDRICVTRIGGTGDLCHSSFNVSSSLNSIAEVAWSSFIIVWKILCYFPGFVRDAPLYQSCSFFNTVQNAFAPPPPLWIVWIEKFAHSI